MVKGISGNSRRAHGLPPKAQETKPKRGRPPKEAVVDLANEPQTDGTADAQDTVVEFKPRGPKTGSKGKAPKSAGSKPGHNVGPLDEEQEQALFLNNLKKITAQKEIVDSAVADLRNLYKVAKSDGFEKCEFDAALAIRKRGTKKFEERMAREVKIAKFIGQPLQMELFGGEPDRTPDVEKAFEAGRICGMEGGDASPPSGVAQKHAWQEGFYDGAAVREQILRMPKPPSSMTASPISDAEFGDEELNEA